MTSVPTLTAADSRPEKAALRAVTLAGPAGRLEALLNEGSAGAPYAALVCHPHPLGGGTMHNKVAYHAMKVLNAPDWGLRWPVLRFNFRGAGLSEGDHDGAAEPADVVAALNWLEGQFKKPVVVVGFSFGAAMALAACCDCHSDASSRANVRALAALGLPIHGFGARFHYPYLSGCRLSKLFLSGDRDEFAPASELKQLANAAADPKQMVLIPGADHSFSGQLDAMQRALSSWLKEQVQ
jgi:alpha/beta superfamily hydrolase